MQSINTIAISGRKIGPGNPVFVIAEAGINHNGNIDLGHKLIDSAVEAGVDAVKFQSYFIDDLLSENTPKACYQRRTTGSGDSMREMLNSVNISADDHFELKQHCNEKGIIYLCTPYEKRSVDLLDGLDVPAFKIASTDTTNIPLLKYIAKKNRPILLSTGMCSLNEVKDAVATLVSEGAGDRLSILQCTSEYPAPYSDLNLKTIPVMEQLFGMPVGFSDHTPGVGASPWAVALGAHIVEKHFTLDKKMLGPDHQASLEPDELSELVETVKNVQSALGNGNKQITPSEEQNKSVMQKSVVSICDISAGSKIRIEDLTCKRPATGLQPSWLEKLIGQKANKAIKANTLITMGMIDWT